MISPHLPPPTCSIAKHHRLERLKFILLFTVVSVVAGFSGAAILVGWVLPTQKAPVISQWYFPSFQPDKAKDDAWVNSKLLDDKTVVLYNNFDTVENAVVLADKNKAGLGIIVSSDGWLVSYLPGMTVDVKKWKAYFNNHIYTIDKVIVDPYAQLVYTKISPLNNGGVKEQFPVVSFTNDINVKDELAIYDGRLTKKSTVNASDTRSVLVPRLDSAPVGGYRLDTSFPVGSFAADKQGRLAGIVVEENFILGNEAVSQILPQVFLNQPITHFSLGVEGYLSTDAVVTINGAKVSGFLVTKVRSKNNLFKVGDIIKEINGQLVSDKKIWYYKQATAVNVELLRAGKTIAFKTMFQTN